MALVRFLKFKAVYLIKYVTFITCTVVGDSPSLKARASRSAPVKYKEAWKEFSRATFWKIENWVRVTLGLVATDSTVLFANCGCGSAMQSENFYRDTIWYVMVIGLSGVQFRE